MISNLALLLVIFRATAASMANNNNSNNKQTKKKKKKKENSGNKASCPRACYLREIHPSASLTVVRELTELEPKTTQCTFTYEVRFTRLNRKRTPYENWD